MSEVRLQKLMAQAGLGSRRASETIIAEGRVAVNGHVAKLGDKADPGLDTVTVDGRRLKLESKNNVYIILNKPRKVVTTNHDDFGRETVRDLVKYDGHLFAVGRLDVDSEGLVLLTNDGEVANVLTHPRFQHSKEYIVFVKDFPSVKALNTWRRGVILPEDDYRTAPAEVEVIRREPTGTMLRIVMREGRKRQIREVARVLRHPVQYLLRVRIGPIDMGDLKPGKWRFLHTHEIKSLRNLVDKSKTNSGETKKRRHVRGRIRHKAKGGRRH